MNFLNTAEAVFFPREHRLEELSQVWGPVLGGTLSKDNRLAKLEALRGQETLTLRGLGMELVFSKNGGGYRAEKTTSNGDYVVIDLGVIKAGHEGLPRVSFKEIQFAAQSSGGGDQMAMVKVPESKMSAVLTRTLGFLGKPSV